MHSRQKLEGTWRCLYKFPFLNNTSKTSALELYPIDNILLDLTAILSIFAVISAKNNPFHHKEQGNLNKLTTIHFSCQLKKNKCSF